MKTLFTSVALSTALIAGAAYAGSYGGAKDAMKAEQMAKADIVDTAIAAGSFTTLVAAVEAAGLVETLKGEGPFTVFAPTDDAFAKLPEGTVAGLLKPENKDQLTAILTYHVISGKVKSGDLAGKTTEAETVEGRTLTVDATGDAVLVNGATVTAADVKAKNGVIHIVDTVLLPPAEDTATN